MSTPAYPVDPPVTYVQFTALLKLSRAYGHEWACNFECSEQLDGKDENERALWLRWFALVEAYEHGEVPDQSELFSLGWDLFGDSHYPVTPSPCYQHETCTRGTRWAVRADGGIDFEFFDYEMGNLLARFRTQLTSGERVAMGDKGSAPWAQREPDWRGDTDHRARVTRALVKAGCSESEASRAVAALDFWGPRTCHFDLASEVLQ